ncbi:uncharacterized protein RJT20DRAFT_123923 [Scheffersomyces xylosifermentans]|uniref:uncharacterized protein n=1 Tax=Scheffersomyces xylosifermentans TaxID=1304137 RepID=UPI00315C55F7
MIFDFVPLSRSRGVKLLTPIAVIFIIAALDYGTFWSLGHQEIYKRHSKGVAIALWVLVAFTQFNALLYWSLIFIMGPGKSPQFQPLDIYESGDPELTPCPDMFFCDQYGFPTFNSHAQSIMVNRAFFSKDLGYNVLKYDHYCLWIGTVIGEPNYIFFMKYCQWFLSFFLIMMVFLIRYTPSNVASGEINHMFIPMYILGGLATLIIGALYAVHNRYVAINMTTLDEVTGNQRRAYAKYKQQTNPRRPPPRKEEGIRYVNVKKDDLRLVVSYDVKQQLFNMGYKRNWINLVYNGNRNHGLPDDFYTTSRFISSLVIYILPYIDIYYAFKYAHRPELDCEGGSELERKRLKFESYGSQVNEEFRSYIYGKAERKECYIASYVSPQVQKSAGGHYSKTATEGRISSEETQKLGKGNRNSTGSIPTSKAETDSSFEKKQAEMNADP